MVIATTNGEPKQVQHSSVKCVVVGDGAVGKTSMLIRYATGKFPQGYIPTVFDNYAVSVRAGESHVVTLSLFDTAGQEDYDRLRPLSYSNADIFLVCFNTGSHRSFQSIREKWLPELRRYCPGVPWLLVGLQADRRKDEGPSALISPEDAVRLAQSSRACKYVECSAKASDGIKDVFAEAILICSNPKRSSERRRCSII